MATIDTATLAPGEYLIEVDAGGHTLVSADALVAAHPELRHPADRLFDAMDALGPLPLQLAGA
jgi:hypothetical protein